MVYEFLPTDVFVEGEREEVERIARVMEGVVTQGEAAWLWGQYSQYMAASWLIQPDDDQRLRDIVDAFRCGYLAALDHLKGQVDRLD